VTSIVDDPQYLYVPWVVSNQFRREADGSKWNPQPCDLILLIEMRASADPEAPSRAGNISYILFESFL
jgi:hypothetical protein